jgi:hypothetical protein
MMNRDPQISVGVGNAPFPANAPARMADLCRTFLGDVAARDPNRCAGCGHDPHDGRPCGKTIAGMGGVICTCKGTGK